MKCLVQRNELDNLVKTATDVNETVKALHEDGEPEELHRARTSLVPWPTTSEHGWETDKQICKTWAICGLENPPTRIVSITSPSTEWRSKTVRTLPS